MDATNGEQADRVKLGTILIIDDDAEWTEVLKLFFLDKYQVHVANSACDAIEMARAARPGVILVDLVMPSMDGFGIIRRMHDSSPARIPTILLTGWNTAEVEECASAMGCAAVLSKPVDLDMLGEVIKQIIGNRKNMPATVM